LATVVYAFLFYLIHAPYSANLNYLDFISPIAFGEDWNLWIQYVIFSNSHLHPRSQVQILFSVPCSQTSWNYRLPLGPETGFVTHTKQQAMLSGSLSPRHGASSGCGWRRRPPDMEGSCEYIE
jgi:hypothetical protein